MIKLRLSFCVICMISFMQISCVQKQATRSPGSSSITGLKIRWPDNIVSSNNGLALKLSDTSQQILSGSSPNLLNEMADLWNQADAGHNFIITPMQVLANRTYSSISSYNDNQMGIYTSSTWFSDVPAQALAVTQFYGRKKNIGSNNEYIELFHADIIINVRDYTFSAVKSNTTPSRPGGQYDLASVILHELGHFLGLGHQNDYSIGSVMQPYLSSFDDNRTLFNYDKSKIKDNYNNGGSNIFGISTGEKLKSDNDSFAIPVENDLDDPSIVSGRIELRSDGQCFHILNKKIVKVH